MGHADSRRQMNVGAPLGHLRVLELPGAATLPAGKIFADLGATVVKVEPSGGDLNRFLPPLGPTGSGLFWDCYSLGKKSVTLDLEHPSGRSDLMRMVGDSDVILESYKPGTLAKWEIGYEHIRGINPRVILTSITPFGQTGPICEWNGSDLVHFAMGGYLNMTGPPDGAPLKPSAPLQTLLHGSGHAVAATLMALRRRRKTNGGAHVDVAMRDTAIWMLTHTYQHWDFERVNLRRQGSSRDMGTAVRLRGVYRCKDGYLVWLFLTGHIGARTMRQLVDWMDTERLAPEWLSAIDWETFDVTQDLSMVPRLEDVFGQFFRQHTKAEMLTWAIANRAMLAPVQTIKDVLVDPQLSARGAWRDIPLRADGPPVRVPGPPVRMSRARWEPRGPGVEPGEQTVEILESAARGHIESSGHAS